MSPTYRYPRPAVTVDLVLLAMPREQLEVLLIQRKSSPYRGQWAVPGGFLELDEELEDGARRELLEETGVKVGSLEPFGTFGAVRRDPRGRTISVAFLALTPKVPDAIAGDDAAAVGWYPLDALPPLAFDHDEMLAGARRALRRRAEREAVAFELLPRTFTLARLRRVYEQVLGKALDPSRFRRRALATGVIEALGARDRSAALYRLSRSALRRAGSELRFLF